MKILREALDDYLALRRGLGFKLRSDGVRLQNFIAFMERKNATFITTRLALEWSLQLQGLYPGKRLIMVRAFAKYMAAFDSRTEVPPVDLIPLKEIRPRPHIYTESEIQQLLEAAWTDLDDRPRGTYCCLFGLLAVTGLRVGEAIRLQFHDVDLKSGILTIRDTKCAESRLVPLHPTTIRVLREYKKRRDRLPGARLSPHFFTTSQGTPLYHQLIYTVFRPLLVKISLRKVTSGSGPRLHDLRHQFAVRTMINWYKSGEDIERRLPALSAFLGHRSVESTYWYLTEYPELMQLAAQRLETRWEGWR